MSNIVVVGSISTDFIVGANKRPLVGETIEGTSFTTDFGGKGANQAVACARLGAKTSILGAVGGDEFAERLLQNLQNNNINISNVERVTHSPSGSAVITLVEGDNSIIYVPGANAEYNPLAVRTYFENRKDEKIDLVLVQNETKEETVESLIDLCNLENVPVLLNPAPARTIAKNTIDKLTFLTPNETEFKTMFPNENLKNVLTQYPKKLIVTLGSKGAIFHDGKSIIKVPSIPVENVEDTTGAGDTFNGAFAVAVTSGLQIEESIKFGNLAAAIAIQNKGAQNGMPTLKEMKGRMEYEKKWDLE